jgi:hypothetical protein
MPTARKKERPVSSTEAWVTLYAAAKEIGMSRLATLTLIVKGDLIGQHLANQTFVRRDSLDRYLAAR